MGKGESALRIIAYNVISRILLLESMYFGCLWDAVTDAGVIHMMSFNLLV